MGLSGGFAADRRNDERRVLGVGAAPFQSVGRNEILRAGFRSRRKGGIYAGL